jgi:hypothetical protein
VRRDMRDPSCRRNAIFPQAVELAELLRLIEPTHPLPTPPSRQKRRFETLNARLRPTRTVFGVEPYTLTGERLCLRNRSQVEVVELRRRSEGDDEVGAASDDVDLVVGRRSGRRESGKTERVNLKGERNTFG